MSRPLTSQQGLQDLNLIRTQSFPNFIFWLVFRHQPAKVFCFHLSFRTPMVITPRREQF